MNESKEANMTKQLEKTRVEEIIDLHNEIGGYLKMSLEKAIRIGELLTEEKASLKHGEWLPWIRKNMPFTYRTADRYMTLFNGQDTLKLDSVSNLNEAYTAIREAVNIERKKKIAELKKVGQSKGNETLPGTPDGYYEREKVPFTRQESNTFLVCLALGPNHEHPYIETADFRLSEITPTAFEGMNRDEFFDKILALHEFGIAHCYKAGTWGNYFNPKMEPGCETHFIRYSSGNKPEWFQSGLEHGLPESAFKTDVTFIEADLRTNEEKAEKKVELYEREIKNHEKEIEKIVRRIEKEKSNEIQT